MISVFIHLSILRLFTRPPHIASFFCHISSCGDVSSGVSGGMHDTRRWMAFECEQSWTAAVSSPDDGQARPVQSRQDMPILYRYCIISRSPLAMIHHSHRPSSMIKHAVLFPLLFLRHCVLPSLSAEDSRSESSRLLSCFSLLGDIFGALSSAPTKLKKCLELLP